MRTQRSLYLVIIHSMLVFALASCGEGEGDRRSEERSDTTQVEGFDRAERIAQVAAKHGITLQLDTFHLRFSIEFTDYLNKEMMVGSFIVQDVYLSDTVPHVVLLTNGRSALADSRVLLDLRADADMVKDLVAAAPHDPFGYLWHAWEESSVAVAIRLTEVKKVDWRLTGVVQSLDEDGRGGSAEIEVQEPRTFHASGQLIAVHRLSDK